MSSSCRISSPACASPSKSLRKGKGKAAPDQGSHNLHLPIAVVWEQMLTGLLVAKPRTTLGPRLRCNARGMIEGTRLNVKQNKTLGNKFVRRVTKSGHLNYNLHDTKPCPASSGVSAMWDLCLLVCECNSYVLLFTVPDVFDVIHGNAQLRKELARSR